MISENKWPQYGQSGLIPKGIVIHNTKQYEITADEVFDYYENISKEFEAVHYIVDKDKVVEIMPVDWKVWSTGKGNDWAFKNCLVVTICSTINSENFNLAEQRAISLIKDLADNYEIPKNRIYFHKDFNPREYCPAILLDKYKTREKFIEEVFK